MRLRARATIAGLFSFALFCATRAWAQQPVSSRDASTDSLVTRAKAGDAQAQFDLANSYFNGVEIPQDYAQAVFWYRQSSNKGFAPAQNQLGNMYEHKFGLPRDYKRALAYYRLAASQGYALGQYDLGLLFENGAPDVKQRGPRVVPESS
jgi:TPR repeat protein